MVLLTQRYDDLIAGSISCFDRILIQGTLPGLCYSKGMTAFLKAAHIRIFDYPQWALPLREIIRQNAHRIAERFNIPIEPIPKPKLFSKEDRIKQILLQRGLHPGLVAIFSTMEVCQSYKPWFDKATSTAYLKPKESRCLYFYFYFIDPILGLCYMRVPTWAPFRLQFYFNGHNFLANLLDKHGIAYTKLDNGFIKIADFDQAQRLADSLSAKLIHKLLDKYARLFCPVIKQLGINYHWSFQQVEYSTDIIFTSQKDLKVIYEALTRAAVLAIKPDNIATFLGKKLLVNCSAEVGNNFLTRIEGTRIKHRFGPVSIKMYDKFGLILRIEITINDVSFFHHYRKVEHRDSSSETKYAAMKKTIHSLGAVAEVCLSANQRYIEFISSIEDTTEGVKKLSKITKPALENGRRYRGLNFFEEEDLKLLESIERAEYNISGFGNRDLREHLEGKSSGQVTRQLKRLRTHGLIKRVGRRYKYYLTRLGRAVIAAGLELREMMIIPRLARSAAG